MRRRILATASREFVRHRLIADHWADYRPARPGDLQCSNSSRVRDDGRAGKCPDLVVGKVGHTTQIEIKDGPEASEQAPAHAGRRGILARLARKDRADRLLKTL